MVAEFGVFMQTGAVGDQRCGGRLAWYIADYFGFLLEMVLYAEPYDLIILLHIMGAKTRK